MKKFGILLALALAAGAVAQNKTSAAIPSKSHSHSQTPTPLAQPPATRDETALPVGTAIRMKLETPLSTTANKFGDRFGGRVTEAVVLNGKTIIPVGAALEGQVVRVEEHRRIKGKPELDLRPTLITLPDGQRYSINATIVDTSDRSLSVTDEGAIKGPGHNNADLVETGVGAAVGAGIGAKAGGFKGAMIGMGIGGGATVVHWLMKTKTAEIRPGTEIIMELSRPMALTVMQEGD